MVLGHRGIFYDVEEIALDPAAETSGNLLRCLLIELNLSPRITSTPSSAGSSARLLIGDQAIRFRQERSGEFEFWDLGEQWKKLCGVPFVYALWLVRPEVNNPNSIADRLRELRDENLSHLGDVIAEEKEFDRAFCDRYYRQHLGFNFGEDEKTGLHAFAKLCQKHELLPKRDVVLDLI